ncbi:uncharacterized protein [Argopecten irradians]|uniref:uncharacterized protein n=1 Tax=Argopecten irradians TaxID=31199 RepID=UPI003714029E
MLRQTAFLVCFLGALHVISGADWTYTGATGQGNWANLPGYSDCGGQSQSPIDLPVTKYYNPLLTPFTFHNYAETTAFTLKLRNTGYGAQVDLVSGNTADVKITNGGLPGTFKAAQFHFHWGADNTRGSEHTSNGTKFPMEVHIVHYNMKYTSIGEAITQPDGLAVLGVFFEIASTDNPKYAPIVDNLDNIMHYTNETMVTPFNLMDLLPTNNLDRFYRYSGSLTTPGCFESVTWTVFEDTVPISAAQMAKFRSLINSAGQPTVDNYRLPQPLNDRNVYVSYPGPPSTWGYTGDKGAAYWANTYPLCGGDSQSPIDLPPTDLMAYDRSLGTFEMTNYDNGSIHDATLYNTGYGVQVNFGGNIAVTARNGGLPGTFRLAQFHFHWGSNNAMGSEHFYNGKSYPMEVHFVHYNIKYGSLGNAADKPDGLAVFGFFFEVGHVHNCNYNPVIENLHKIRFPKTTANIDSFNIRYMMTENMSRYYRYKGSLTTPACYESVTWTVFEETIKLSSEQLAQFREVFNTAGQKTVNNYRPPQPLNTRVVYLSYDNLKLVGAGSYVTAGKFLIAILAAIAVLFH